MRILVEPGSYSCLNMGDMAMFQVTVDRLRKRWPDAEIVAFTQHPDRLRGYLPGVTPFPAVLRSKLVVPNRCSWGLRRRLPLAALRAWDETRSKLRRLSWKQKRNYTHQLDPEPADSAGLLDVIRSSSLVAVSGSGGLCDLFMTQAWSVLELIEIASSWGVRVALFSQGIGPLQNPMLCSKARCSLPSADLIAVRERRKGPHLLQALGVQEERIQLTGDDAIELAYRYRTAEIGGCLGVNMRVADYSGINKERASSMLGIVAEFAKSRRIEVRAVPISLNEDESDLQILSGVFGPAVTAQQPDGPVSVIRSVGLCRMIVTGSYHGAVFALAQGVSAVTLASSLYYRDKFGGVADLFGAGCRVVDVADGTAPDKLRAVLEETWEQAPEIRDELQRLAREQIALSKAAYDKVFQMVSPGAG